MYQSVIIIGALFLAVPVHAASFPCEKAKTQLEHTICDDFDLNAVDTELGDIYQDLLKTLPKTEAEQVRQFQRRWLETRENNCDIKNAACLTAQYKQRIAALKFRSSAEYADSPAGKVAGRYENGVMEMTVEARDANLVSVHIWGAEPTRARWICDFEEEGTLKNGVVKLKLLDDAVVSVVFRGAMAKVDEGDNGMWCGNGGTLNGQYQRK